MNPPCGHKEATHTGFGDIWGCPVAGCDGTERTQPDIGEKVLYSTANPYVPAGPHPWASWFTPPAAGKSANTAPGLPVLRNGNVYSGNLPAKTGEAQGWPPRMATGQSSHTCSHYAAYRSDTSGSDRYFCYDCGHEVTVKTP